MKRYFLSALIIAVLAIYTPAGFLNIQANALGDSESSLSSSNTPAPSLYIVYPKSGDIFHPGDTINVRWDSNNIPENADINVVLSIDPHQISIIDNYRGCIGGAFDDCLKMKKNGDPFLNNMYVMTKNTGHVVFTIPKNYIPSAKYYFYLEYYSKGSIEDNKEETHVTYATNLDNFMDNLFSIVSSPEDKDSVSTGSVSTKVSINPELLNKNYESNLNNRKTSNSNDNDVSSDVSIQPVTSKSEITNVGFFAKIGNFFRNLFRGK